MAQLTTPAEIAAAFLQWPTKELRVSTKLPRDLWEDPAVDRDAYIRRNALSNAALWPGKWVILRTVVTDATNDPVEVTTYLELEEVDKEYYRLLTPPSETAG